MKKPIYIPSLEGFIEKARKSNIVPVHMDILADTLTPVSAFMRIDSDGTDAFLLESVEGGEKWGRYSFLGVEPSAVIRSKGSKVEILSADDLITEEGDPIEIIKRYMGAFDAALVEGAPKFFGGAIGYIGYDAVRYIEKLPELAVDDLELPEIYLIVTDTFLVFDNMEQKIKIVSNAFIGDGEDTIEAYQNAMEKINSLAARLKCRGDELTVAPEPHDENEEVLSNFVKGDFLDAVKRTKEYIREGDVIQAVISQRFSTPLGALKPIDIYRALRVINPSPYMFFLRLGGAHMVGSSPEILVATDEDKINVRPIAGTRPRGKTEAEDMALEVELLKDPKERAEHIMLVDLGRNDVGRVARTGTVEVDEFMEIERYSHVMHIVSNVSATMREGMDAYDALRACFPAGTLTGAPKIRAMEIIEELELQRRGVYGGSVGYLGFSGNMDMAITIRTILIKDGQIYVQAGAGIVADSVPENEYEETISKASGMLKAVEMARGGLD